MPGSPRKERGESPVHIPGTQKARPTKRGPGWAGINSARRYKIAGGGTIPGDARQGTGQSRAYDLG